MDKLDTALLPVRARLDDLKAASDVVKRATGMSSASLLILREMEKAGDAGIDRADLHGKTRLHWHVVAQTLRRWTQLGIVTVSDDTGTRLYHLTPKSRATLQEARDRL